LSSILSSLHTSTTWFFPLLAFLFYSYGDPRDLHSFPTRRSSDLEDLRRQSGQQQVRDHVPEIARAVERHRLLQRRRKLVQLATQDRKSTRLNSSHVKISYAVFCLKKKKKKEHKRETRPRNRRRQE